MQKFSCYLIGKDNLLIECCKILLSSGNKILGIFSESPQIKQWSNENQIILFEAFSEFESNVIQKKADYLFSIINDRVLNNKLIESTRRFSINYHDSLLPTYAGVHATSWALLNGEKKHGITWHVIDDGIDTGDILLQDSFNIAPDETTFSLNMKCYASAIAIFPKLIQLLQNNAFCRVPQNLAHRTYFGLHQKPTTLGWIDWDNPAEKIANLIRALDFDDYENRLASAKCLFGQQIIVIKKISVLLTSSRQSPGTILHFDNNSLTISTQTTDVILSELHSLYGEVLHIRHCCKKNHLSIGSVLASNIFDKNNSNEIAILKTSQNECFWVTQYKNIEETHVPFLLSMNVNNPLLKLNHFKLSPTLLTKLNDICHGENNLALITATMLFIYLVRINNKNMGSTYIGANLSNDPLDLSPSLSTHAPLTVSFSENTTFSEAYQELKSAITRLKKHGRCFNDLYLRYPALKNGPRLPLAIIIGDSIDSYSNLPNLVFLISDTKKQVDIFFQTGAIEEHTEIFLKSMSSHIQTLMQGISKAPNMSIFQLPVLTKKEIKLLTIEWNKTKTNYPRTSSLQQLFENQVHLNPDKIVACLEDTSVSYQELNEHSNQLAYYLQGLGLQPHDHVCILLDRSFELIITILAILKAGGIYIPIDPEQPQHRILHIIDDCKPRLFISLTLHTEQFSFPSDLKTVLLDKNQKIIKNHSTLNLPPSKHFPQIANIMYTSGSTGKPKGIEITHRGIVRLVKNTNFVGIKNSDCIALLANPMFDAFTFEVWGALLNGASLFILTKEVVANPQLFQSTLLNHNVSILLLTSAFFDLITQIAIQSLEKIHTLIVVGDVLSKNSVRKTLKHHPIRIINGYGPTENTGATTYYEINALSNDKYLRTIPIGKPVSNSTVYICDKNLQLLPIGATGELLTGGDGLANAYFNNRELTKKSFIKNPFNTTCPFLYKTGDLVRWLPNGNIEYIGRYDSLVKIRGFRVDLSEIEQVLLKHPKILGAIVSVNKSATTKQKLIAFIILKKDTQLDTSAINHYLSLHLPPYMIPSSYLFLDKFPLSLNGKIDKEKLFTSLPLKDSKKTKGLIPLTELQSSLAKIWHRIFKNDHIEITDNFFDLGGDSIIAMQIQFEARQLFIHLTVKDIFTYKNILDLSSHVEYIENNHLEKTIAHQKKKTALTPIQSWFFEQRFLNPEQFSQYCVIELSSEIPVIQIETIIRKIIINHDCFHLRYQHKNQSWIQYYAKNEKINYSVHKVDWVNFNEHECTLFFQAEAQKSQKNFRLGNGPLFAVKYIRSLVDKKLYLLFTAHHLIFDGVSWRIFLTNFASACSEKSVPLQSSYNFIDWSLFLSQYAKNNSFNLEKNYYFSLPEKSQLKYDHEKGMNHEASVEQIAHVFSQNDTQIIQKIAHQYNLRIDELILAICVKTLCEWQNRDGILIDIERHGREELTPNIDTSTTMGWFTSLFPMYFDFNSNKSIAQHFLQIKQKLDSIPHNGIHYGILRYLLNLRDNLSNNSLISFNYWGQFDSCFGEAEGFIFKELGLISHPQNHRTHQINIESCIIKNKLNIKWIYSTNFFKKSTFAQLCDQTKQIFQSLLSAQEPHPTPTLSNTITTPPQKNTQFISSPQESYTLTSIQTGLLFHTVNAPGCEAYAVQLTWKIADNCDLEILKKSFDILIHRHPILRVCFEWIGLSKPIQIVQKTVTVPWHEYDWTASTEREKENRLHLFLKTDRQTNFSLARAPLVRVSLLKLDLNQYQIVVTMHHILLDGWSMAVLLKELEAIYQALSHTKPTHFEHDASFFDYIAWLEKQEIAPQKKKWKKYLRGFYTTTDLPLIKKHDQQILIDHQENILFLNSNINDHIKSFCQKYRITLSTIMQATWGLLLSRYSGQHDVVFGLTISVRPPEIQGIEKMAGIAINTIPFRIKINEQQTTLNYLKKIQSNFIDLLELSSSSLTDIHSWSEIERGTHLFNSILVVENYPTYFESSQDFFRDFQIIDPTHYPLTIAVSDSNDGLFIKFSYDSNHITHNHIETLVEHFKIILLDILEKPLHAVLELEMMSNVEKQKILQEWNHTDAIFDHTYTISAMFENQVQKTPQKFALIFENIKITYQELNQSANQVAHYLREKGVTTNTLVALYLDRGPNLVIGLLAILKAGGAYIPIDPMYPKARIQHMLTDSAVTFILTEQSIYTQATTAHLQSVNVIFIDKEQSNFRLKSQDNLQAFSTPKDLMYVIYTSGSTGKPKGVMIEQFSMINFLYAMQQILNLNENDIWLAITPISFDISGLEIFLPLLSGAQCVIASKNVTVDGKKLTSMIMENNISVLQATPMTWEMLLEAGWENKTNMKILCGGEPLKMKLCEKLMANTQEVLNLYGPTETTIWSTYLKCEKQFLAPIVSIGKPIGNTKVYVLDKHLKLAPIGIIGELYIGGLGLARGYLNQPQLTADKFIPNPFDTMHNSLLYKTGDLVCWSEYGTIDYIGRSDEQIKIRGHRVELGEIQNHIEAYSGVKQAAVLLDMRDQHDAAIIACVCLHPEHSFNENEIREYLKNFLPRHMIPRNFIVFSKFPLTPNKKIDKIKLRKLIKTEDLLHDNNKTYLLEPINDTEKTLSKIWSRILSISSNKIGRHANFFDLGGHSLKALQVLAEIRQIFNLSLEVHLLFEFPTIETLANKIQSALRAESSSGRTIKPGVENISSCLINLKSTGNKKPLFLIHPVGGTVFWYTSLAKHIDDDRPLYGIQDPGLHSDEPPFNSVSELADFYIRLIRSVQAEGPYLIGGASAGANISMEIALQMQQQNQEIGFIGLLDGWAYYPMNLEDREIFESLMLRQFNMMEQQFISQGIFVPDNLLRLQWHRSQMNHKYIPPCLNNQLTLFKAREILPIFQGIEHPLNHWENYSTMPILCEMVPGDHETMFNEPNAIILSKKLSGLINKTGL